MPLDARLHVQEGHGRLAHFAGAVRVKARDLCALAKGFRRGGQALDRAHLVADEQHRHRGEQQGGPRQPHDEGAGLGGEGPVARRQHPHHALGQLDPDVDVGRVAGGVEPERAVEPVRQRPPQGPVLGRKQRLPPLRRQALSFLEGDGEVHVLLGLLPDPGHDHRSGIVVIAAGRPGDVTGKAV